MLCQAFHSIGKKLLLKQIHQQCCRIIFANLSWIWVELEVLCEGQWTREVKSLNPSSSESGNFALEKVPWWERQTKKCDSKNFFEKHSACIVCSEKDKRKCDSKEKIWEAQCLYCVQWENGYGMQAGEHAGARRLTVNLYCVQWENGYGMQAGEHAVARRWTMKLVRDSGQSAKRSAAVRGQAGRGATVAGGRRPDAAEHDVGIFWPARFCGRSRADLLLERQSTALLPSCDTHLLPFLLLKMPALDRVKIMSCSLPTILRKGWSQLPDDSTSSSCVAAWRENVSVFSFHRVLRLYSLSLSLSPAILDILYFFFRSTTIVGIFFPLFFFFWGRYLHLAFFSIFFLPFLLPPAGVGRWKEFVGPGICLEAW